MNNESKISSQYVMTLATGKQLYLDLAVNLARSFFYWHPHSNIIFQIVTDRPAALPDDIKKSAQIINITPGKFGVGFSTKLQLDLLASEGQTLFIDSDCLIFDDLEHIFHRFKGNDVSVLGDYVSDGEWFGNISQICDRFGIPCLPKFNGGIYYLEKGIKTTRVYETARILEQQYDEIGFVRLRGQPNDEVLMALAMQLNGQTPIHDDGTIMSDPQACPGRYHIDVLTGDRFLVNPRKGIKHQDWYPFHKVSPAIIHFLGHHAQHYPYQREAYKLKMSLGQRLVLLIRIKAYVKIQLPHQFSNVFKGLFRPLYRLLFGYRKIEPSERLL